MPKPTKYRKAARLSQRWPAPLLKAIAKAAKAEDKTATEWLQEVARKALENNV
jgi:hypothetical protein